MKREKHFVKWLNSIKNEAEAIYLLGDIFDFWFEYNKVVPKGFTRLLGKLSELTDSGEIKVSDVISDESDSYRPGNRVPQWVVDGGWWIPFKVLHLTKVGI